MVEPNGFPDYRYNDREIIRAFADNSAPRSNGWSRTASIFVDKAPDTLGGASVGNSVPREMHAAAMDWPMVQTGKPADPGVQATTSLGQRPDASAGSRRRERPACRSCSNTG